MWSNMIYVALLLALYAACTGAHGFSPEEATSPLPNGTDTALALQLYQRALERLTVKAHSDECKAKIIHEYHRYLKAFSSETHYPFESTMYHTQCPSKWSVNPPLGVRDYPEKPMLPPPPPKNNTKIPPSELSILYIMLVHDHTDFVASIIDALDEPQHKFVVHVDAKPKSDNVHRELSERYRGDGTWEDTGIENCTVSLDMDGHTEASDSQECTKRPTGGGKHRNVWVMEQDKRVPCNWGGFTIVNATLIAMRHALHTLKLDFDYCLDVSGTSYPIKGNARIREELSRTPGAIYMDVVTEPQQPQVDMWNHYVECDDAVHRVSRMALPKGIYTYVASQWFSIPKHVVEWIVDNPLPVKFIDYAQHYIVADENYFATMILNSPYCDDIVKKNHVLLLFDKWEHELKTGATANSTNASAPATQTVDKRKCLHPYPDNCGRSPTTLTMDDASIVRGSRMLFARKFDPMSPRSMELLEFVKDWIKKDEELVAAKAQNSVTQFMIRVKRSPAPHYSTISKKNTHTVMELDDSVVVSVAEDIDMREEMLAEKKHNLPLSYADLYDDLMRMTTYQQHVPGYHTWKVNSSNQEGHEGEHPVPHWDIYFGVNARDLCLSTSGTLADPLVVERCDPNDISQIFTLDSCFGNAEVHLLDGQSPVLYPVAGSSIKPTPVAVPAPPSPPTSTKTDDFPEQDTHPKSNSVSSSTAQSTPKPETMVPMVPRPESICQIVMTNPYENVCVDINGQNYRHGANLIGWECTGAWNQLFTFKPGGILAASMPKSLRRIRSVESGAMEELCLESTRNHEGKRVVLLSDCEPEIFKRDLRRFEWMRWRHSRRVQRFRQIEMKLSDEEMAALPVNETTLSLGLVIPPEVKNFDLDQYYRAEEEFRHRHIYYDIVIPGGRTASKMATKGWNGRAKATPAESGSHDEAGAKDAYEQDAN